MTMVKAVDFSGKVAIVSALSGAAMVGLVTVLLQVQSIFSVMIGVLLTLLAPKAFQENLSLKNILQKLLGAGLIFFGIYLLFV